MLQETRGIVLNHIKYGEKSLVTTIYTELYGRKSYLIQNVFNKKSNFHPSLFQPLTLLIFQSDQKPNRELQRIREVSLIQPFQTIPFDVSKRSVTLFLAEVLVKTIKEEEANPVMFEYIYTCIQLLDITANASSNFHLVFLINLSRYLGFYPTDNFSEENCKFNLTNGTFRPNNNKDFLIDSDISIIIHKLMNINFNEMDTLQLGHDKRLQALKVIIEYFNLHLGGIGEIKSLSVLEAVFSD